MARPGITYADINKAAKEILQQNQEPTVDRVREILGTGSKSTIAPLLKQWKESHQDQSNSHGLPNELLEVTTNLYERLQAAAAIRIQEAEAQLEVRAQEWREHLAKQQAAIEELLATELQLKEQLQTQTEESRHLKESLEATTREFDKTQIHYQEALSKTEELKQSLEIQKRETQALQERFEHYQQQMAEDRQRERDEFRLSNQNALHQIQQLMQQLAQADARFNDVQTERKLQQQWIEQQRDALADAQEEHAKTQSELHSLSQRYRDLQAFYEQTRLQLIESEHQKQDQNDRISAQNAQISLLENQLKQADITRAAAEHKAEELIQQAHLLMIDNAVLKDRCEQLNIRLMQDKGLPPQETSS